MGSASSATGLAFVIVPVHVATEHWYRFEPVATLTERLSVGRPILKGTLLSQDPVDVPFDGLVIQKPVRSIRPNASASEEVQCPSVLNPAGVIRYLSHSSVSS